MPAALPPALNVVVGVGVVLVEVVELAVAEGLCVSVPVSELVGVSDGESVPETDGVVAGVALDVADGVELPVMLCVHDSEGVLLPDPVALVVCDCVGVGEADAVAVGVVVHATPFHDVPLRHTASQLSAVQRAPALAFVTPPAASHASALSVVPPNRCTARVAAPTVATVKMLSPAHDAGCTPTQRRSGRDHAEPGAHSATAKLLPTTALDADGLGVAETVSDAVGVGDTEGVDDGGTHAVLTPLAIARTTLLVSSAT